MIDGASAVPEPAWRGWRAELPRRAASVRLTLACAATSDGPCWIGQPTSPGRRTGGPGRPGGLRPFRA